MTVGSMASVGCNSPAVDTLTQIKQRGEIHFLTRNSPTTYYEGVDGPTGLEYDLMKRFADQLGVKLRVTMPENFADIIPMIATGQADIAAAGLTVTGSRRSRIRFGPAYQKIRQEVIYRAGKEIPSKIEDLIGKRVVVVRGSSHEAQLRKLAESYPDLMWESVEDRSSEELIAEVWKGNIDFTVADSNEMAINQAFYPEARSAFPITQDEFLAWGISPRPDKSLDSAVKDFFEALKRSGELDQLLERYYSHTRGFNYTETRILRHHIKKRLTLYLPYFKEAGRLYQIDWRFLAAIGYQESHWKRRAISPTGVRGI
ncbi:MAG: lytic transglycosylase F, partial [Gammaproteobacteria bacterium]